MSVYGSLVRASEKARKSAPVTSLGVQRAGIPQTHLADVGRSVVVADASLFREGWYVGGGTTLINNPNQIQNYISFALTISSR